MFFPFQFYLYNFEYFQFLSPEVPKKPVKKISNEKTYENTLEEILSWLLDAESKLQNVTEIADDLPGVLEQFHNHEVSGTRKNPIAKISIGF